MSSTSFASYPDSSESARLLSNPRDNCWDLESSSSLTTTPTAYSRSEDHPYIRPNRAVDSRAPCPGLNTLANHAYIPRSGRNITFLTLLRAIMKVYNLSLFLALTMTVPGFLIYGQFNLHWGAAISSNDDNSEPQPSSSFKRNFPIPRISYTLSLSSLSSFGPGLKIAHRASLVHPNHPSDRPDLNMLCSFLSSARRVPPSSSSSSSNSTPTSLPLTLPDGSSDSDSNSGGLTLHDLASIRVSRESSLPTPLKLHTLHEQVALGESALTWLLFATTTTTTTTRHHPGPDSPVLQSHSSSAPSVTTTSQPSPSPSSYAQQESIPLPYLAQWFGEERLPDGWTRPSQTIGLFRSRTIAGEVQREMEVISWKNGRTAKA